MGKEYDEAYDFLHSEVTDPEKIDLSGDSASSKIEAVEATRRVVVDLEDPETQAALRETYKKVDLRVSVILCGIYFFQFIDKSLLNYAAVMGIKDNLKPNSNQFGDLGTILYCAYIVGEPISAYLFQRLPPAKFFSVCIICWGIVVVFHVFCNNYALLMVVRALLGLFESCVAPGCVLITGMWYNRTQQLRRTCLWTIQAGTATIVGGFLSFCFQKIDSTKTSLKSWQIFFLTMGLLTIIFGVYAFIVLPDSPISSKFLTDYQKKLVLENIRTNQTGTENKTFKPRQLKELLLQDKHTWPMLILTLVSMIPTGAVLTFSVSMIANIGFSNQHAALMQMPLGVTTILAITIGTNLCAHFKGKFRNSIFVSMLIPAIIGYIVLLTCKNKIGKLLAVYLINVGTCVITMIYSWNSANTANSTKRIYRNCLTMVFFAVGCLIGPQLVKSFHTAYVVLLILTIVCIPLVGLVLIISITENRKRDNLSQETKEEWLQKMGDNYEFKDLTDIENITFRYSY